MSGPESDLAAVPEPVALREAWWAAERSGHDRPDLVGGVVQVAGEAWQGALAGAGVDHAWLASVAGGYRRELWLWLVGERTWEQTQDGLAGRVRRRLTA